MNLTLDKRRVDLRSEKVEGERGEEGFERWNNLEFSLVLHRSCLGLSLAGTVASSVAVVRHRRPG